MRIIIGVLIFLNIFKLNLMPDETISIVAEETMPISGTITEWKVGTHKYRRSDINTYVKKTIDRQFHYVFYFFSFSCPPCLRELRRFFALQEKYPRDIIIIPILGSFDTDEDFKQKSYKFLLEVNAKTVLPNGQVQPLEWVIRDKNKLLIRQFYINSGKFDENHPLFNSYPNFFIYYSERGNPYLVNSYSAAIATKNNDPDVIIDKLETMIKNK